MNPYLRVAVKSHDLHLNVQPSFQSASAAPPWSLGGAAIFSRLSFRSFSLSIF